MAPRTAFECKNRTMMLGWLGNFAKQSRYDTVGELKKWLEQDHDRDIKKLQDEIRAVIGEDDW